MPQSLTAYKVFIASPGGMESERSAFYKTLTEYNATDGLARGLQFVPVGWELTLAGIGRPQALINNEIETADFFVLVIGNRWGSATGESRFTSGTQEEFSLAQTLYSQGSIRDIAVLFKGVDPRQLADPGEQ